MNALKAAAIGGEVAVLGAAAAVGWALVDGSNLRLVGPAIIAALAVEATRLPLVLRAPKLGLGGRLVAMTLAFTLSGLTAETMCLGVESVLTARGSAAVAAEEKYSEAQTALDAAKANEARRDQESNRLTAAVATAQAHSEAVGRETTVMQNNVGVTAYRGRRGWVAPGGAAASAIAAANAKAQAEHARRAAEAEAELTAARAALAKVAPVDLRTEAQALVAAKQAVDRERAASPLHRLSASIYQVDPADLTAAQYGAVRRAVILSVGAIISVGTLIAGLVSALPERGSKPSKLARAFKAMIAARRKTLRKTTTVTEIRERVVYRYVPCDPESGKAIG